jgi:tape measure domain-containing protein
MQTLQQFAQAKDRIIQNLSQFQQALNTVTGQGPQQMQALAQSTQQAAQFFAQFNASIGQTNQQFTQINATVRQFNTQLNETNTLLNQTIPSLHRAGDSAAQMGSRWSTMLQIAGGIGIATSIQGIISAMVSLGQTTIETGTKLETMRASLSSIAGSAPAGQQQFQQLFETAQRLGVAFEPLARGWRQLTAAATAAKVPLEDQSRLLDTITKEARRTGATNEELGRAITGLAQMASKGKVSMEELRQQIGEAIPTAMAAAAQGMGRTTAELEKLIETGAVRAPEMFRAFVRGWEQMQQASGTFAEGSAQAFNRLATAWKRLQDTIMQSGLNTYLVTVADNLRNAVEWTTKLMQARPGTTLLGPTREELGATPVQLTERAGLEARLKELQHPLVGGMSPQLQAEIDRTKEELVLLDQRIRKSADAAIEEKKVSDATAKTASDLGIQRDHWIAIATKMGEIRKAREDLAREAAAGPEVFGRPGGTVEEQQTFLKEQQSRLRPLQESLAQLIANPPAGMRLGPELLNEAKALGVEYGNIDKQLDSLREKERARRREASQAEQAPSQVAALQASLARVQTFLGRPGTSGAEQAEAAVRLQGAEMQKIIEQALETIRRNPVIQRLAPELAGQFKAGLAGLGDAVAAQAQIAMDRVQAQTRQHVLRIEHELTRIQALAGRGEVSAPEQARAQALQQGAAGELQLRQSIEQVQQSLDIQRLAPNLRQQLEETLAGLPEDMARQGQRAFERMDATMRERIAGIGSQLEQLGMKVEASALSPLDAAILKIQHDFAAMLVTLDQLELKLGEEFLRATEDRQKEIKALVEQLRATREQVGPAREREAAQTRFDMVTRPRLEREADVSARQFETIQQMRNELEDMRVQRLNQQQGPFGLGRVQTRQEREAFGRLTPENQAEAEQLQAQRREQERLNYAADLFVEIGGNIGSTWGNALLSIADGTKTVSEAFRQMGQSIMQTLIQVTSQEAWKAFVGLGMRLLFAGLTSGVAPTSGGGGTGPDVAFGFGPGGVTGDTSWIASALGGGGGGLGGGGFGGFQHGGIVRGPMLAMLGENSANNPEYVLNRHQMASMMSQAMQRGPAAGREAASVVVVNVATREDAERTRIAQEALGRQVVINHVLSELSQGESSKINRVIRTLQR